MGSEIQKTKHELSWGFSVQVLTPTKECVRYVPVL